MKKLSITMLLVCTMGLLTTSCSNDNNNGSDTTVPIIGKWNFSKVGTIVAGQEVLTDPPQNESGCNKDFIEFRADNTATAGNYDSSSTPCALTTQSGTYVRTGNHVTTVIDGANRVEEILNLTATQLKVKDDTGAIVVFTRA